MELTTQPATATCSYNLSSIQKACRQDESLIREMIITFIETMQEAAAEISFAYAAKDYHTLGRIAHRIKPTLSIYQVNPLLTDVKDAEALIAGNCDSTELDFKIKKIKQQLLLVTQEMRQQYFIC